MVYQSKWQLMAILMVCGNSLVNSQTTPEIDVMDPQVDNVTHDPASVVQQIHMYCTGHIQYNVFSTLEELFHEIQHTFDDDHYYMTVIEKKIENAASVCEYGVRTESLSCEDLRYKGVHHDGIYDLMVFGRRITVYCEFYKDTSWMIFQRRYNGYLDFYRDWESYQRGFGHADGEFWLGLDNLHSLTRSMAYTLRIEMEDWQHETAWAEYKIFSVGDRKSNYTLNVGEFCGDAGDSLQYHNLCPFTTKDRDNDNRAAYNCAIAHHGGWWYRACHYSNLNGSYLRHADSYLGINWYHWKKSYYSMMSVVMKIRPNLVMH